MTAIRAWAARAAAQPLGEYVFDPGALGPEEVEITVEHCGLCHSDLSLLDNAWGISAFPLVAGHEVIGTVAALGSQAKGLKLGQRVGLGWNAGSCMHCESCLGADQHLCAQLQPTAIGRNGGFAERVRAHWAWAVPLPQDLDASTAGPLLCGGITVFSPLLNLGIKPTDRVGVVGIGGLGHMALQFANAWGCEVTAFTSSADKHGEIRGFGAHRVVSVHDAQALQAIAGSLDLILDTVNVPLDWTSLMATLAPKGRLHIVGALTEPMPVNTMGMLMKQQSVSASPSGSRAAIASMLEFAARHRIAPQVERFPMRQLNEALAHLRSGKARYRIVLDADFA